MTRYRAEIKCAWCGRHMGTKSADRPGVITHGICPECKRRVEATDAERRERREETQQERAK